MALHDQLAESGVTSLYRGKGHEKGTTRDPGFTLAAQHIDASSSAEHPGCKPALTVRAGNSAWAKTLPWPYNWAKPSTWAVYQTNRRLGLCT
jgi:hypothetical protein